MTRSTVRQPDGSTLQLPFGSVAPSSIPTQVMAVPSDDLLVSSSPEESVGVISNPGSPTKVKEIVITYPGSYKFKFTFGRSVSGGSGTATTQVYRNGAKVGVLFTEGGNTGIARVQEIDIVGGWAAGDLAQIYLYVAGHDVFTVNNFEVWGEYAVKPIGIPAGTVNLA